MIKEYPTLVGVNGVKQGLLQHHLKLLFRVLCLLKIEEETKTAGLKLLLKKQ